MAEPEYGTWASWAVAVASTVLVATGARAAPVAPAARPCAHQVKLHNGSGEPVVVHGLGPDLTLAIRASGERCVDAPAAVYTVVGPDWRYDGRLDLARWAVRDVEFAPPVRASGELPARAWVEVRNAAGERAELDLGTGAPVGLEAGARIRIEVPAGPRRLIARLTGGRTLQTGIDVEAGRTVSWSVRARATTLTLASGWDEPVLMRVDGWQRATIAANGELRLNIAAGRHRIEAVAAVSKLRFGGEAIVRDGDALRVSFEPPGGTVHVAAKARRLHVLVAGRQVAEVPARGRAELAVDAGRTVVEVRDVDSGRATVWRGAVQPMQQVEVAAPE